MSEEEKKILVVGVGISSITARGIAAMAAENGFDCEIVEPDDKRTVNVGTVGHIDYKSMPTTQTIKLDYDNTQHWRGGSTKKGGKIKYRRT